jgi:hypothetical protein
MSEGFALQPTPMGIVTVPTRDGKPMNEEDFMKLSQEQKDELMHKQQKVQNILETSIRQTMSLDKDAQEVLENWIRSGMRCNWWF